jgi:hypothetical protein
MNSLWPKSFAELEVRTPKEIIEAQFKYLPTLTGDKVYGDLFELGEEFASRTFYNSYPFAFRVFLKGKFLKDYSFELFYIAYGITIYPVEVSIDEELSNEINSDVSFSRRYSFGSEEEFVTFLESVFKSERIKKVIGAIMKLS